MIDFSHDVDLAILVALRDFSCHLWQVNMDDIIVMKEGAHSKVS